MAKKNISVISLSNYKKNKSNKAVSKKQKNNTDSSIKQQKSNKSKIFYMSHYLKTKKTPTLKKTFYQITKQENKNIVPLDKYRSEKKNKSSWRKYTIEALSVSGMTFLFLFTFNVASSFFYDSSSKIFVNKSSKKSSFREIAREKPKDKTDLLSQKEWIKKIRQLKRENVILGRKANSSDYIGF
ncbi:MAG: hypothetical protein OXC37_03585 [Bdellovibrionaceae bacterium]|nr:hypothetical protein [Pseudobdellovibrionaceae bacterium]